MTFSNLWTPVRRLLVRWQDRWWWLMLGPSVLALLFLGSLWGVGIHRLQTEHERVLQDALTEQLQVARRVAGDLEQVMERAGVYARLGESWLYTGPVPGVALGDRSFPGVMLTDARGQPVFPAREKVAADARLQALLALATRADLATGGLKILPPLKAGEGWLLPMLMPVGQGGQQARLLLELDLAHVLEPLVAREVHAGQRVEVLSGGGQALVEFRGREFGPGRDKVEAPLLEAIRKRPEGSLSLTTGPDGPSEFTWTSVDELGLRIVFCQPREQVIGPLGNTRLSFFAIASALTLAVLGILWSLMRAVLHHHGLQRQLIRADAARLTRINKLEQEKVHAYQLASHDRLTGLPNRMLFQDLAEQLLSKERHGLNRHAMFLLDLDRFKLVNDTLGHRAGDQLLKTVAERLRGTVREADVLCRPGGDEFVLLARDVSTSDEAESVARKLAERISEPVKLEEESVWVRASIGIALFPRDGKDVESLMRHADMAMYEAKDAGRGTWRIYQAPQNEKDNEYAALHQALPRAISNNELRLYFQPKVALQSYRITSMEALIRWQHPQHGLLSPGAFIPLIENDELMKQLGLWVARAACAQLKGWRSNGVPCVPIAINVAPLQLRDDRFVTELGGYLTASGVPASLLQVEITESSVMESLPEVDRSVKALRKMGVSIALDDYGTGFASLSQIRRLPLDAIKIDRSFVTGMLKGEHDRVIVSSTITMAHDLGLKVIAEGVETLEQLNCLRAEDCDEVQGYLLHRPAAPAVLEKLLLTGYCPPP